MKRVLYLCIITIASSCNQVHESHDFNRKRVVNDVRQMLSNYHDAINREGLTAEFDYLDESDNFFWVPPGYTSALNYDSIHAVLVQNANSIEKMELEWEALKIFPLSAEIVSYSGIVKNTVTDTASVERHMSIIESGTIIKRKSGWKLLNGQSAVLDQEKR